MHSRGLLPKSRRALEATFRGILCEVGGRWFGPIWFIACSHEHHFSNREWLVSSVFDGQSLEQLEARRANLAQEGWRILTCTPWNSVNTGADIVGAFQILQSLSRVDLEDKFRQAARDRKQTNDGTLWQFRARLNVRAKAILAEVFRLGTSYH